MARTKATAKINVTNSASHATKITAYVSKGSSKAVAKFNLL